MLKSETSTATNKAADKQLIKVQTLLLDSLAPLTAILEAHHKGVTMDHKEVIQAVKSGMHLIWQNQPRNLGLPRSTRCV